MCNFLCNILQACFFVYFVCKSAILHAIYMRVDAAIPVACTVNTSSFIDENNKQYLFYLYLTEFATTWL